MLEAISSREQLSSATSCQPFNLTNTGWSPAPQRATDRSGPARVRENHRRNTPSRLSTYPDRGQDRLTRIAVIGPSPQWKDHITKSIADVGGQGVSVFCLNEIMEELSFGLDHELHLDDEHYLDTDWRLGRVARLAASRLQSSGQLSGADFRNNPRRRAERVVNQLVKRTDLHQQLVSDPELSEWLLQARNWDSAKRRPKYFPFLAAVGLEVNPPTPAQRLST